MKKLLILSDSHRNIQNMVEAVEIEKPDMIIHLGDHYRDAMQLAARFPDTGFACVGRDDLLRIFHDSADPAVTGAAAEYLSEQMHFPERVFQIRALEAIPKNEAGKTQYRALEEMR